MTDLQRSVLAISSALVILLVALIYRTADNQAEKVRVREETLVFDSASACEKAKLLAARFPQRAMGTDGGRVAADWIESQMSGAGLQTRQQEFTAWLAGERVTGRNVIGVDKGIHDETIVVIAHYDIPFHVREGAMDDASGVGVLLEIAGAFSRERQKKTLVFIASDGEEWGMLGARHYVKTLEEPSRIRAVISLDCMTLEHPEKINIGGEGQFRGQVPLWLWMLAEDCISQAGGDPGSLSTLMQFVSRAVNISSTDQGPFVSAGIPGVNLGGDWADSPLSRKVYHTTLDTSENLRPELFDIYGRTAELMVRTLDGLDYSTDNEPYYLRTGKRTHIGRCGLRTLQILLFLPLLMATGFQYYNLRAREKVVRDTMLEAANIGLFVLPWALALLALYLLVWKNVIPRYELYPATPLDPFLSEPNWKALAVIAATFVAAWVAVALARRFLPSLKSVDFAGSKAICLDMLLTLSIVALFINGFAAALFLAPAALLWGWIEPGRRPGRLCLNLALAAAATGPFVLLAAAFSEKLMLGPYVFWYFLLGAGYGFFSPPAVLITVGAATCGVRLLQKSVAGEEAAAGPESLDQ